MTHQQLWELCLAAACRKTQEVKAQYNNVDALAFNGGYSSQSGSGAGYGITSGSSSFSRKGSADSVRSYSLPAALQGLINRSYENSEVSPALRTLEDAFLSLIYSQANGSIPGTTMLSDLMAIDPHDYPGESTLQNIIARNPYSSDYEEGTANEYQHAYDVARSAAMSGPGNVRGGQNRQALELAEMDDHMSRNRFNAVRGQQNIEASIVSQATQIANQLESMRRGQALQAQGQVVGSQQAQRGQGLNASDAIAKRYAGNLANVQLAGELLGSPKLRTSESFTGSGLQTAGTSYSNSSSGHGSQVGGGCCFIFLECLNGQLPWYVRWGRDNFGTPARRRGYVWMSKWLVPTMQRFSWTKALINTIMIKPFLKWGRHLYDGGPSKWRFYKPVCWTWFHVWSFLGSTVRKENYAGQ